MSSPTDATLHAWHTDTRQAHRDAAQAWSTKANEGSHHVKPVRETLAEMHRRRADED